LKTTGKGRVFDKRGLLKLPAASCRESSKQGKDESLIKEGYSIEHPSGLDETLGPPLKPLNPVRTGSVHGGGIV
jgi:hypothetical protein